MTGPTHATAVRRFVATTALAWCATGATTLACPICFQVEQGPVTEGVRAAVLVLMGVTVAVLSGFGVFIARFVARSRQS
jgi:hypothetical protein